MKAPVKNREYLPQLDTVRAIAVILVIISHWFSPEHFFNRYTDNGKLGVTLFFVLSGFLITGILLKSKAAMKLGLTAGKVLKVFYLRRALRIFPVYYFLLLILVSVDYSSIRAEFSWHFFYISNIFFWLQGAFTGPLQHGWSLSVEEQFYLIWPAIILFTTARFLKHVLWMGLATGLIFRLIFFIEPLLMGQYLMPACLDCLCVGGLVALARYPHSTEPPSRKSNYLPHITAAVAILTLMHLPLFDLAGSNALGIFYAPIVAVSFGLLVYVLADTSFFLSRSKIMRIAPLIFIGRISYGMYLFHTFISYPYNLNVSFLPESVSIYVAQLLRLIFLIAIATLSWYIIEKPFLRMKPTHL